MTAVGAPAPTATATQVATRPTANEQIVMRAVARLESAAPHPHASSAARILSFSWPSARCSHITPIGRRASEREYVLPLHGAAGDASRADRCHERNARLGDAT